MMRVLLGLIFMGGGVQAQTSAIGMLTTPNSTGALANFIGPLASLPTTCTEGEYEAADSDGSLALGIPTCHIYFRVFTTPDPTSLAREGIAWYSPVSGCSDYRNSQVVGYGYNLSMGSFNEFVGFNPTKDAYVSISSAFYTGPQPNGPIYTGVILAARPGSGAMQLTGYNIAGKYDYGPGVVSDPHFAGYRQSFTEGNGFS